MKCIKINNIKEMLLDNIEIPTSKEGNVIIKVNSCGICGSDIHYWTVGAPKGLVMGHEFAGEIVDPGARTDLKIGDRVTGLPISPCDDCEACQTGNFQYCKKTWDRAVGLSLDTPGGYAEYTSCRADMIRKIPDNVTDDEAAMTEPSAVALHAINLANIKVGNKVLIIGAGIIGLMAAEFARLNGASYIAILETNEQRGKKAVNYGKVDEFYDAKDESTIPNLQTKTNGGFDIVIECCGSTPAVKEAIMCTKPGGTVVLVGVSLSEVTIPTVVAVMSEIKLQGAIAYTKKEFETCLDLISKKTINVSKYIDAKVPLEKAQESFERLTSGTDDAIKIILKPNYTNEMDII